MLAMILSRFSLALALILHRELAQLLSQTLGRHSRIVLGRLSVPVLPSALGIFSQLALAAAYLAGGERDRPGRRVRVRHVATDDDVRLPSAL